MPQAFFTMVGPPEPFTWDGQGTTGLSARIAHLSRVTWDDASVDLLDPASGPIPVLSAYDGAETVDATLYVWLILLVRGASNPVFLKELDYLTADSHVSGSWGLSRRIDGAAFYPVPQV